VDRPLPWGRRWGVVTAVLLLAAVVAGIAVAGAGPAFACSCVASPPPETAMSEADAVFVGEVIELRDAASGTTRVATLAVTEVFAGEVRSEVDVRTPADEAACGHAFVRGRTDLVYAVLDADGVLNTNLCDRTAPLSEAAGDLAAFGEGSEPARDGQAAEDPTDPEVAVPDPADGPAADASSARTTAIVVAIAIGVVIAVTILVQRRRRPAGGRSDHR
jgi:hypothetical protein